MAIPKPDRATIEKTVSEFRKTITKKRPRGDKTETGRRLGLANTTVFNHLRWHHDGKSGGKNTKASLIQELSGLLKKHGASLNCREYENLVQHPGAYRRRWRTWESFKAEGLQAAGIESGELSRIERQRYDDKITRLNRELRDLSREMSAGSDVREAIFRLAAQAITPPDWILKTSVAQSQPGTPILFTSDFQWGEVIRADEMDGVNAFNREIASRRYKMLIERTVDLCYQHMVKPDYDGIIYLRGGDSISGDIHDELRETNDLSSIPAVLDLVEHEVWGIGMLAEKFGKVWVISVSGNHGRQTVKPHSKHYADLNYDYLLSSMIEREFAAKKDDRVVFTTPKSGDAIFNVHGYPCLLTHGDRIGSRGGQGFIGPAATITRGMKKLHDYYAVLGQYIYCQFIGHFHTPMELEYGFSNGSLPGGSEYSRDLRARPQPPAQWLTFIHPKWGKTARWLVYLDRQPKLLKAA